MKKILVSTVAFLGLSTSVVASDFGPAMAAYLNDHIAQWAGSAPIVGAIAAQNEVTSSYDQARIDALDAAWRTEVGASSAPTITPVISNATSDFLREMVEESHGRITEVFIMDARGLNAASSGITSDYWQGDEAKFTETFPHGPGATHFGDIEFDESSQTYQGQISITIVDPATGQAIGAMTVGVDAEALM